MEVWNFRRLYTELLSADKRRLIHFLVSKKLIPQRRKCVCGHEMILQKAEELSAYFICWLAELHPDGRYQRSSRFRGTIFKPECPPEVTVIILLCMANSYSIEKTVLEAFSTYRNPIHHRTVWNYFHFFREAITDVVLHDGIHRDGQDLIGGRGVCVEIVQVRFESDVMSARTIITKGTWIFAMIECKSTNYRIVLCSRKKLKFKQILAELGKCVRPETKVLTTLWIKDRHKNGYEFTNDFSSIDSWPSWHKKLTWPNMNNAKISGCGGTKLGLFMYYRNCYLTQQSYFDELLRILSVAYPGS